MTVKELYEMAKSLMFEKQNSRDYDAYYKPWINQLLQENFVLNNNMREARYLPPLEACPYIINDDDVIPYESEVCLEILPKGLAKYFFIDDDLSKFNIFEVEYKNAQARYCFMKEDVIVDVYA